MKHAKRNYWSLILSTLIIVAIVLLIAFSNLANAASDLTPTIDSTSIYGPTQIKNGDFESQPWVDFKYNSTRITSPSTLKGLFDKSIQEVYFNGVDKGWNTTERTIYDGTLFEWSNNIRTYSDKIPDRGTHFVEMNAYNSSVFFQDLTTASGSLMQWKLKHGFRNQGITSAQSMKVVIGAPKGNPSGTDPNIKPESQGSYTASGVTGNCAYATTTDLKYLTLYNQSPDYNDWRQSSGLYVVPHNQTVTRFAFISTSSGGSGNLLDDIEFYTLLGNFDAQKLPDGSVIMTGYWGDKSISSTMVIDINGTKYNVNMSNFGEKSFMLVIPKEYIGSNESFKVYHSSYINDKCAVNLTLDHEHQWTYTNKAANQIVAKCSNATSTCKYQLDEGVLTLDAENTTYTGSPYAGVDIQDEFSYNVLGLTRPDPVYYLSDGTTKTTTENSGASEEGGAPVYAGSYIVKISPSGSGVTAQKSFTISKKSASVTVINTSKTYDKNTSINLDATFTGLANDETITLTNFTGTFNNAAVSSATTITPSWSTATFTYSKASDISYTKNYNITLPATVSGTITKKDAYIKPNSDQFKEYGQADPSSFMYTCTELIEGDTFSGSLNRTSGSDAGEYTYTTNNLTNSNYNIMLDPSAPKFKINPAVRNIEISSPNKIYDKSSTIDLKDFGTITTNIGSEKITISSFPANFDNENAGSSKSVSANIENATLSYTNGAKASNYTLTLPSAITGTITQKAATIKPNANQSKEYGQTDSELEYSCNELITGDVFTGTISRQNGEDVSDYNYTLGTIANSNYSISLASDSPVFKITQANRTIIISNITKVYDRTNNIDIAEFCTINAGVSSESIEITTFPVTFNDSSAAVSKTINANLNNATISYKNGAKETNYNISLPASITGTITKKDAVIKPNEGQQKEYGQTEPSLTYECEEIIDGDTFSGTIGRVTGEDAKEYTFNLGTITNSNYNISLSADSPTFKILPASRTIEISDISKVYDKSSSINIADCCSINANVGGETITITSFPADFEDQNAGSNKNVIANLNNATISYSNGAKASNYSITLPTTIKGDIYTKTASITPDSNQAKEYSQPDPTFTYTCNDLIDGDSFTGSLSRTSGEDVDEYNYNLGTLENPNYMISLSSDSTVFKITPAQRIIEISDISKTYDKKAGIDIADLCSINSGIGSEKITITEFPVSFDNQNAGELKTITANLADATIEYSDGAKSTNYQISLPESITGTIFKKQAVINPASGQTKEYGQDNPTYTYTCDELIDGDSFSGDLSRVTGENVGEYAFDVSGLENDNYEISLLIGASKFSITQAIRSVQVTETTKVYDSTNTSNLHAEVVTGIGSETIEITNLKGTYNSIHVTEANTIQVLSSTANISYNNGALATNYKLVFPISVSGNITTKPAEINPVPGQCKEYGTPNPIKYTYTCSELIGEDVFNGVLLRENGEDAGDYQYDISQLSNSDYQISLMADSSKFQIKKAARTVSVDAFTKTYDSNDIASPTANVDTNIDGEEIKITDLSGNYNSTQVTEANSINLDLSSPTVQFIGDNAKESNYLLTWPSTSVGTITPADVIVLPDSNQHKEYGSNDPTELTYTTTGLIGSDILSGNLKREVGQDAGEYAFTISDLSNTNYNIYLSPDSPIFKIDKAIRNVEVEPPTKNYDSTTNATINAKVNTGIGIETIQITNLTGTYNSSQVTEANNVDINLASPSVQYLNGAKESNYSLIWPTSVAGTITAAPVTITPDPGQGKLFLEDDPEEFTFTQTGILDDEIELLNGRIEREPGEDVGEYKFLIGSLDAGTNYLLTIDENAESFIIHSTELELHPKEIINQQYDGNTHIAEIVIDSPVTDLDIKYSMKPFESVETPKLLLFAFADSLFKDSGSDDITEVPFEFKDVIHTVVYYKASAPGYITATGTINVDIYPKEITVTANNYEKLQGESDPEFCAETTGLVDNEKISYTISRQPGEDPGEYILTPEGQSLQGNYSITYIPGKLTINKNAELITSAPTGDDTYLIILGLLASIMCICAGMLARRSLNK